MSDWYHLYTGCDRCRQIRMMKIRRIDLFGQVFACCNVCGAERMIVSTMEASR